MSGAHQTFLPAGPLLELLERRALAVSVAAPMHIDMMGIASDRSISRWRRRGLIRLDVADRVAIALGLHPADIWGWDAYTADLADVHVPFCDCPACRGNDQEPIAS